MFMLDAPNEARSSLDEGLHLMDYETFFQTATGHPPYGWQKRLAENPDCQSRLIDIPTGLGKTAGVVLAWLWNRCAESQISNSASQMHGSAMPWPRRLVYCLPMRTLVEQTVGEVERWLINLWNARDQFDENTTRYLAWLCGFDPEKPDSFTDLPTSPFDHLTTPPLHDSTPSPVHHLRSPVILMGGEDLSPAKRNWDLYPERPCILIGTQDMLLSRALNRGYGMSRYRWPMHFALLNNDALWVMDEVQLMGAGLASTTQLEGFRNATTELGSSKCRSWWMSATIRSDWLKTVDMPEKPLSTDPVRLLDTEKSDGGRVEALRTAKKALEKADVHSGSKNHKAVADFIFKKRSDEGLNLVVVNTVKRAGDLHHELKKLLKDEAGNLLLLHSQFRPDDRQRVLDAVMQNPSGKIVISTQVIEAGVDLSAHTLFTELAPWSSLVQRFGRCNRWLINGNHHFDEAHVYWFDLPDEKDHLPYKPKALESARDHLNKLSNAAIQFLEEIESPDADRPEFRHVIRRKDLIELFDTTPDLAGADLDIDRFIRDADDSHVSVFWRHWQGKSPNGDTDKNDPQKTPQRNELCSVSIGDFRAFTKNHGPAWRWNALDREWQSITANDTYPGQIYLLHVSQGGYDQGNGSAALPTGWNGNPKSTIEPVGVTESRHASTADEDAYDGDSASEHEQWQTITQHTDEVCREIKSLIDALGLASNALSDSSGPTFAEILLHAARWHDWGKAHPAFQAKLKQDSLQAAQLDGPPAKAPDAAWIKGRIPQKPKEDDERRPHFRHELASALGILLTDSGFSELPEPARDLAAYLIAAHHGKVRLSIRSLPKEWQPPKDKNNPDRRFARGIWDGDELPGTDLGDGATANTVKLSLEPMELGLGEEPPFLDQPSWAERVLTLRDQLGPFRLAFLETLLRAADGRASKEPEGSAKSSETDPKQQRA